MSTIYYPRTVGIELVRGCNFSCKMCPVTAHKGEAGDKISFMELPLLQKICQEIDLWPSIETIWLFGFGESLLHPHFSECLEVVYRSQVARRALTVLHTNALVLRGEKARALLEIPAVKKVAFSFDGFGDRESFEVLRGPHYEEVLHNIRQFAAEARRRRPELQLVTCTIIPREGEVPGLECRPRDEALAGLRRLFEPLGVQVEVRDMHDYSGNDLLQIKGVRKQAVYGGCAFVENDFLEVTVSGRVQPCCAVYDEGFNIGSIEDAGFGELLNSPAMSHLRHHLRLDKREQLPYCGNCALSLGGWLDRDAFREFWLSRDDQGAIDDLTERRHIFGTLLSEPHRIIRVDLGCGKAKQPGFTGIDRFPLPGVDVIADMDKGLPLKDNSVDFLLASHSLEHTDDLLFTMQEIYRVCKHKALVCIVAPYHHTSLNMANPYHKQVFNEHTPRFFTTSPLTAADPADYQSPHAMTWGLAGTDNSPCTMDFRCLKIEFFYFPRYRHLNEKQKRELRQSRLNVVDTIMYHLLVVKEPITDEEVTGMANDIRYQEPPYITIRRLQEHIRRLQERLNEMEAWLALPLHRRALIWLLRRTGLGHVFSRSRHPQPHGDN